MVVHGSTIGKTRDWDASDSTRLSSLTGPRFAYQLVNIDPSRLNHFFGETSFPFPPTSLVKK